MTPKLASSGGFLLCRSRRKLIFEPGNGSHVSPAVSRSFPSQFKQRGGWTKAVLLQVNKRARQLDQALVERAVGPMPILEPKLFQNIMRLVILPAIKAVQVTLIKRIQPVGGAISSQARDPFSFVVHCSKICRPQKETERKVSPRWCVRTCPMKFETATANTNFRGLTRLRVPSIANSVFRA